MKMRIVVMMLFCAGLALVVRADMVAQYTFDDDTANDSSGNGNNGTLTGGVTIVTDAVRGKVLNFDGVNGSYVRVPASASLNAVASQITIAMWLNTPNIGTRQLIEKGGTGGTAWYVTPWGIRMEADRTMRLNWGNGLPVPPGPLNSTAVPLNTWTHVAMTYDSSLTSNQRKFYINGVLDTQNDWAGGATTNTNDLFIGTDWYNATSRWAWIGMMDDLKIFNTALDESEIGNVMTGSGVTNIDPKSGAIRVPVNQVLSWNPPEETEPNFVITGYDVYFDPNQVKVENGDITAKKASNQAATTYDPFGAANMPYLSKYFWRVDVVGQFTYKTEPNTFEGAVFSFTTMSLSPEIISQPVNQVRGSANSKPDAVLSVTAVNATNYQWYKNDVLIPDATAATLTLTGVQQSDEGRYYCIVSNTDSPDEITSNTVWVEYARLTNQWGFEDTFDNAVSGGPAIVPISEPNNPTFAAGKIGTKALSFDGGDYATVPVTVLPKAGTEMTYAFWAKNNTPTAGTVTLYAYATAAPGNRLVNIHTPWSNNNAYLDVSNSDSSTSYDRVAAGSAVVTTGEPYWIHWVFTKDIENGGVMRIYRDGVRIGQATGGIRRQYGADQFCLGANRDLNNVVGQYFNGLIDDLRIYNYALDEVEAAYLYYDAVGEKVCINATDPLLVKYDFNGNCKIDLGDLAMMASNWMVCQQVPNCVERP